MRQEIRKVDKDLFIYENNIFADTARVKKHFNFFCNYVKINYIKNMGGVSGLKQEDKNIPFKINSIIFLFYFCE